MKQIVRELITIRTNKELDSMSIDRMNMKLYFDSFKL